MYFINIVQSLHFLTRDIFDWIVSGLSTNVRLVLKLIQECKEESTKEKNNERMTEMMLIIDEVKSQIQKTQTNIGTNPNHMKRREAELRRCNTDVRRNLAPRDKRTSSESSTPPADEKERLRRELNASMGARKSLESICSSIGKEKEIIAKELARTVQQLHGMEEHVNDLKAQNEMLMCKVQACVAEHRVNNNNKKKNNNNNNVVANAADVQPNIEALQKRNRVLTEQLLKSLDAYRSLKRKLKEYQQKRIGANERMQEMGVRLRGGLDRIHSCKELINQDEHIHVDDIQHHIYALENMFKCIDLEISKQVKIKNHRVNVDNASLPA